MKFEKKIKFDKSGPLLAIAQNYMLHSSLPLCSLLLTNCEGSHSVRLLPTLNLLKLFRCVVRNRAKYPTCQFYQFPILTKSVLTY